MKSESGCFSQLRIVILSLNSTFEVKYFQFYRELSGNMANTNLYDLLPLTAMRSKRTTRVFPRALTLHDIVRACFLSILFFFLMQLRNSLEQLLTVH